MHWNEHTSQFNWVKQATGLARLTRTRLIRSSTLFEVSVKTLPDSYHFMFKMHG